MPLSSSRPTDAGDEVVHSETTGFRSPVQANSPMDSVLWKKLLVNLTVSQGVKVVHSEHPFVIKTTLKSLNLVRVPNTSINHNVFQLYQSRCDNEVRNKDFHCVGPKRLNCLGIAIPRRERATQTAANRRQSGDGSGSCACPMGEAGFTRIP